MQHISTPAEEWRPIPGWEGFYEASSWGRVRSVDRIVPHGFSGKIARKGKMLSPSKSKFGHLGVNLSKGGKVRYRRVHQLVLEAFVGPRPPGMETCHNDGNPANNHVGNLRWDTPTGNALDMVSHGRGPVAKTHCPQGHLLEAPNNRKSAERPGYRRCLACYKARGYIRTRPHLAGSLQALSDRFYAEIVPTLPR